MKKVTKRTRRAKRTKPRTNHVKTLGRELAIGELDQVYGGTLITDQRGTKA